MNVGYFEKVSTCPVVAHTLLFEKDDAKLELMELQRFV